MILKGNIRVDGLGGSGKGLLEIANSDLEGVASNRDANDAAGGGPGVGGRQLQQVPGHQQLLREGGTRKCRVKAELDVTYAQGQRLTWKTLHSRVRRDPS